MQPEPAKSYPKANELPGVVSVGRCCADATEEQGWGERGGGEEEELFLIQNYDTNQRLAFNHPRNKTSMSKLFRFPNAAKRDPSVDLWMRDHPSELGAIAREWFQVMRACGDDVRELLHDGHPTACVADAAFAYVNAFKAHVNVGFFRGTDLADPEGLLEGTGKLMRHVKLKPGHNINAPALKNLIHTAYEDMNVRMKTD